MLHTNLLPEQEQRIIIIGQWIRIVRFFSAAASTILLIGITLLAPSYLPLFFQNSELQRSLFVHEQATKQINADDISSDAAHIRDIISSLRQSAPYPTAALDLFDLLSAQPPGITISSFTIDRNGGITITGFAATRDNLLALEQFLRDSSRFQDIASPLTNIIQETDINFSFKGTLKPNYSL